MVGELAEAPKPCIVSAFELPCLSVSTAPVWPAVGPCRTTWQSRWGPRSAEGSQRGLMLRQLRRYSRYRRSQSRTALTLTQTPDLWPLIGLRAVYLRVFPECSTQPQKHPGPTYQGASSLPGDEEGEAQVLICKVWVSFEVLRLSETFEDMCECCRANEEEAAHGTRGWPFQSFTHCRWHRVGLIRDRALGMIEKSNHEAEYVCSGLMLKSASRLWMTSGSHERRIPDEPMIFTTGSWRCVSCAWHGCFELHIFIMPLTVSLQWYLWNDPRTGRPRSRPLLGSLLGKEGLGLAVRFIRWIGTNMENYNYKNKAKELVLHSTSGHLIEILYTSIWTDTGSVMQTISILEAVHSALQNRYADEQMTKEKRSRNEVSLLIELAGLPTSSSALARITQ